MKKINYTNGDATKPIGNGIKIIVHICNDIGGWGKGFVMAISRRWKEPEAEYRKWHKEGKDFELGGCQIIQVESNLFIANMIGQNGIRGTKDKPPIRYDAVEKAIEKVALFAQEKNASVHMPRIGCGLAGGKWDDIEPILEKTLLTKGIDTIVYDYK